MSVNNRRWNWKTFNKHISCADHGYFIDYDVYINPLVPFVH